MRRAEAVEDLLVLAREQELSAEDVAECERAVEASLELRLLLDAGYGFDAQARLQPGDEAKMQRLVAYVMQQFDEPPASGESGACPESRYRRRRLLGRTWPKLLVAAACLLLVGAAVAWQAVRSSAPPRSVDTLSAAPSPTPHLPRAPAATGVTPIDPVPTVDAPPALHSAAQALLAPAIGARRSVGNARTTRRAQAPSQSTPGKLEPGRTATDEARAAAASRATAAELFAGANLARREGDTVRAIQLYQQLIHAYPESIEAADAHTVLGKLELDRAPAAAVWQFRQSQERGATAEALWGEAESLQRMGSPDERGVLERIVREFPSSPYAPAARARLSKLGP